MQKVQPKILSGFMELLPEDQIMFDKMINTIKDVYQKFGFLPLDTPTIELSEVLLAKAGGETEKQIYRFNKGDNDLSLRFDLTVPLARYVAMHYNDLAFPFKRYQISKVFRGERPQKGRFREFYQCDIDIIGNESLPLIYDAEIPAIIYELFKQLNFGDFIIRINNRKILNGLFAYLKLTDISADILRVIDKIDKIGVENIIKEFQLMNLNDKQIDIIINFISIKGNNDEVITLLKNNNIDNSIYLEGVLELENVINNIRQFNVDETNFIIDLTIARGLDYYTGIVYETNLLDYPNLGSICSGGRYENLTGYYTEQNLPGIGISIGLTRLFSQLKEVGLILPDKKCLLNTLIIPLDESSQKYVLNIASILRKNNIITDVYYGDKSMKVKMKYANRLKVPYVVLIGSDEIEKNVLSVKNMNTGEQEVLTIDELIKKFNNN